MKKEKIAYLFLNGELLGEMEFYKNFMEKKIGEIFCADGGYNFLVGTKLLPKEIWGDMDSINLKELEILEKENKIELKKFDKRKNYTDGELLVKYLTELCYDKIYIIAGLGGRKSHELINISMLSKYPNLIFLTEKEQVFYIKRNDIIENIESHIISFLPLSETVEELSLKGFDYELQNYKLEQGDSRCLGNKINSKVGKINYKSGVLIAILENHIN
jgi:thiamine pyrophosphokinase